MFSRLLLILVLTIAFISCSKDEKIYQSSEKIDPYIAYKEGYDSFKKNNFFYANKKFLEAELNFENYELAAKSAIMSCFSLYGINFYTEALGNIERFLKTYPVDKNVVYAEYLKAMIYFERISGEEKDVQPLLDASRQIDYFVNKYPDTDYAIDLKFKKELVINQLAAKELYIAKYYISVQKWIPAVNRLKIIVNQFDQTIFIEEALHRLVEIHYYLGLEKEAKRYAKILGYNYNSSDWFKQSYKILNKDYKITKDSSKKVNKEKNNILKKILKKIK
tara:strand:+ start:1631 stop:2461 length:831 start_codon:yes stop_codon:yes gene_type:complete